MARGASCFWYVFVAVRAILVSYFRSRGALGFYLFLYMGMMCVTAVRPIPTFNILGATWNWLPGWCTNDVWIVWTLLEKVYHLLLCTAFTFSILCSAFGIYWRMDFWHMLVGQSKALVLPKSYYHWSMKLTRVIIGWFCLVGKIAHFLKYENYPSTTALLGVLCFLLGIFQGYYCVWWI